ncbi:hypothetical protein GWK47_049072 [Chionoecetes opilio]|uniref:Uncharacterized protein n=1 Tax=Chionoecetes opilio TaxID=41210 RepID=A0A8J4YAD5_CHIOP|nr:hypothetical protein GWK47_049072 [Chionoecetes opilio]
MRRPGRPPDIQGGLGCLTQHPRGQGTGQTRCRLCREQQFSRWLQTSRQATGTNKPTSKKTSRYAPPSKLSRAEEVVLHRNSAWYVNLGGARDGFEERPCEHCPHMTPPPLTHYLFFLSRYKGALGDRASARKARPPSFMAVSEKSAPGAGGGAFPAPPKIEH